MKITFFKFVAILCCLTLSYQTIAQKKAIETEGEQPIIDTVVMRAMSQDLGNEEYGIPLPNIIPPSPQSQIFEKYVNHAITEYNGLPNISIPLYELEIKGLKIPIALTYHASGIQYMQHDGEVGAGWSISAGGYRITRTINGRDDLFFDFYNANRLQQLELDGNLYERDKYLESVDYVDSNWPGNESPTEPYFGYESYTNAIDGEYDDFTYITPSTNGHFIISERNISDSYFKTANAEHKLDKITIASHGQIIDLVDDKGFKFSFGEAQSNQGFRNYFEGRDLSINTGGTTAWALNFIESPYGQTVSFDYERKESSLSRIPEDRNASITFVPASYPIYPGVAPPPDDPYATADNQLNLSTVYQPLKITTPYITKINGAKENVEFVRAERDGSLNTPSLIREIVITSTTGDLIKKIKLCYKHLPSWADTTNNEEPWHILLDSVKITDGFSVEKSYAFDYYEPKQGARPSPDYWNYYRFLGYPSQNHLSKGLFIPKSYEDKKIITTHYAQGTQDEHTLGVYYPYGIFLDRSADTTHFNSFSLKKITFPTGGYTVYDYELNKYYDNEQRKVVQGAGMRIKEITSYPEVGATPLITKFQYGVDGLGKSNSIISDDHFITESYHVSLSPYNYPFPSEIGKKINTAPYTLSNTIRGDLRYSAYNVYYPEVTTYQHDGDNTNGRTVSTYIKPPNFSPDRNPLLLLSAREIISKENNLVQKENYSYTHTPLIAYDNLRPVKIYSISGDATHGKPFPSADDWYYAYNHIYGGFYQLNNYSISLGTNLLRSKATTLYTAEGSVAINENYEYDDLYRLKGTSQSTSSGEILKTSYRYPEVEDGTILVNHNMLTTVLEEVVANNNQEIKRIRNNYPIDTTMLPLPTSVETSVSGEANMEQELAYTYDRNNGNLIQYVGRDGIPVSFFWGYNEQYPIIKAVNIDCQNLKTLIMNQHPSIQGFSDTTQLLPVFSYLQQQLPNAHISGYTYLPLIGVTSETGPDGISTYYHYDKFGRLRQILDHNLNVVKQYKYHYANQADDGDEDMGEPNPNPDPEPTKSTVYISVSCQYVGQNCTVYVTATQPVASNVTVSIRGSGGLGHFQMTIPSGSSSIDQFFYVPGDTDVEIEDISPSEDDSYYYVSQTGEPSLETEPVWVETGVTRCELISMESGGVGNSGKLEHEYVDENPNSTSYDTKKWEVKSAQVSTNSCPATYTDTWNVIDDKYYFIQPYRSYNDGRNMKYTVTVYYQVEPIPGQPSHIISQRTITAYPFQGVTGTQGAAIDALLGEQERYHSYTVSITQE